MLSLSDAFSAVDTWRIFNVSPLSQKLWYCEVSLFVISTAGDNNQIRLKSQLLSQLIVLKKC
jgi:hypothetical protein